MYKTAKCYVFGHDEIYTICNCDCDTISKWWRLIRVETVKTKGETGQIHHIKGIVHPQCKKMSSFSHPHVVPNLFEFLSYVKHKKGYLEKCWQSNSWWSTIDIYSISFPTMEVNWDQ